MLEKSVSRRNFGYVQLLCVIAPALVEDFVVVGLALERDVRVETRKRCITLTRALSIRLALRYTTRPCLARAPRTSAGTRFNYP
jgi:hypothetical protein